MIIFNPYWVLLEQNCKIVSNKDPVKLRGVKGRWLFAGLGLFASGI